MKNSAQREQIIRPSDIPAALGLLSRLPISVDIDTATARGAKAAWAYPVAGAIVAGIACILGQIALWVGLSAPVAAGLVLAGFVITTGAMHEDGLADTADGFWGGWDVTRRLEIMKDSHIGTYGVLALILAIGLRWLGLTILIGGGWLWVPVIATAMLSRAVMVGVMAHLPHARTTGLSHSVGRPSPTTFYIAFALAAVFALLALQMVGLGVILVGLGAALICGAIAKWKITGQTGDVLGATQQITEIAVLIALGALLA